jgi:streptogramin lyase
VEWNYLLIGIIILFISSNAFSAITLVSNGDNNSGQCSFGGYCESIFKINSLNVIKFPSSPNLNNRFLFQDSKFNSLDLNYWFELFSDVNETIILTGDKNIFTKKIDLNEGKECSDYGFKDYNSQNCYYTVQGIPNGQKNVLTKKWVPWKLFGTTLQPSKDYLIKIHGIKPLDTNVEWSLIVNGITVIDPIWYNTDWNYRMKLTVTNNSGGIMDANIPIDFNLNTQSLISAGKMNSDCNDIILAYDRAGVHTSIPYQIDFNSGYKCNTPLTKFFALSDKNIASLASDSNYYFYYGNPSITSAPSFTSEFTIDSTNTQNCSNFRARIGTRINKYGLCGGTGSNNGQAGLFIINDNGTLVSEIAGNGHPISESRHFDAIYQWDNSDDAQLNIFMGTLLDQGPIFWRYNLHSNTPSPQLDENFVFFAGSKGVWYREVLVSVPGKNNFNFSCGGDNNFNKYVDSNNVWSSTWKTIPLNTNIQIGDDNRMFGIASTMISTGDGNNGFAQASNFPTLSYKPNGSAIRDGATVTYQDFRSDVNVVPILPIGNYVFRRAYSRNLDLRDANVLFNIPSFSFGDEVALNIPNLIQSSILIDGQQFGYLSKYNSKANYDDNYSIQFKFTALTSYIGAKVYAVVTAGSCLGSGVFCPEYALIQDLNLSGMQLNKTSDFNCSGSGLNFENPTTCWLDWNIMNVHGADPTIRNWGDSNYYLDIRVYNLNTPTLKDDNSSTLSYMIDTTAPTTSNDKNVGWQSNDQNIHLTCSDATSGCFETYYRIDGNNAIQAPYGKVWSGYSPQNIFQTVTAGQVYNVRRFFKDIDFVKNSSTGFTPMQSEAGAQIEGFINVSGVAIDGNNNVWETGHDLTTGNFNILRIYPTANPNKFLQQIIDVGTEQTDGSLAIDQNNNPWFTQGFCSSIDGIGNYLYKINPINNTVSQMLGDGVNQCYRGMAFDSNNYLWVTDTYGGVIHKYDPNTLTEIANFSNSSNTAVAVDGNRNVWFPNGINTITRVYQEGITQNISIGSFGVSANALAIDGNGNVWITILNSVIRINPITNTVLKTINGFSSPNGIAIDANQNVWVTQNNKVAQLVHIDSSLNVNDYNILNGSTYGIINYLGDFTGFAWQNFVASRGTLVNGFNDNNGWKKYDGNILFDRDKNFQLEYYSVDKLDNAQSTQKAWISIDRCAPSLNQNWVISTQIDCNFKAMNIGTGSLIINSGGRLKLYDSNLLAHGINLNTIGNLIYLFIRSFIKVS